MRADGFGCFQDAQSQYDKKQSNFQKPAWVASNPLKNSKTRETKLKTSARGLCKMDTNRRVQESIGRA